MNCVVNKRKKLRRHFNEGTSALTFNINTINGSDILPKQIQLVCVFISIFGICECGGALGHFQNVLVLLTTVLT